MTNTCVADRNRMAGGAIARVFLRAMGFIALGCVWAALASLTGCTALKNQMVAPRDNERLGVQVAGHIYDAGLSDHADIALQARAGVVTLHGRVPTEQQAVAVVASCEQVPGVSQVDSRLRVDESTPEGCKSRRNLIEDVREAFESNFPARAPMLLVEADAGVVYLSGIVADARSHSKAVSIAMTVPGVRGVEDNLVQEQ